MNTTSEPRPAPRLRPLSVGETLDVAIKICITHWATLLKAVLVIVVPVQILSALLTADSYTSSFQDSSSSFGDLGSTSSLGDNGTSSADLNGRLGGLAISTILQILAVLLVSAACFRVMAQAYLGESTDWRASLSFAARRAGPLLWLTLLYTLGLAGGVVLLLVGTVWLYVAWAFAVPALLVEGVRGRKALGRSFGLVRKRWWRTFGVIILGFLLAGIVSGVVQFLFVFAIVIDPNNDALLVVLVALAGILSAAISTPFQAALLTVLYFDLRVRKEGFDLELLAREIGGREPSPGGLPPPDEPRGANGAVDLSKGPRLPGVP